MKKQPPLSSTSLTGVWTQELFKAWLAVRLLMSIWPGQNVGVSECVLNTQDNPNSQISVWDRTYS